MKVVHLCNLPLPEEHPDYSRVHFHPGRWVLNLAIAQRQHAGIDARLVMQVPGARNNFRALIEGVPVHYLAAPDKFRSATLFLPDVLRLRKAVLAEKPDVVHAHGTEDAYGMAALATGKPNVITLQGVFALINRELPPKLVSRERVVELLEAQVLRRAKHVVAKSDYIGRRVSNLFPNLIIHRIPNTFDARLLAIDTTKIPRSACFVGMVTERKGLDLIADALRRMDRSAYPGELHVVGNRGDGAADYDRKVLSDLRQLLGDSLILHGVIPALDAARIIARCEVLLAPSREEMFGNQLIEALTLRTFPIVSEGTALAENVRQFGSGKVISSGSIDLWSKAISSERHWRAEDMESARRQIERSMGPSVVAAAHSQLYTEVCSQAAAGS